MQKDVPLFAAGSFTLVKPHGVIDYKFR